MTTPTPLAARLAEISHLIRDADVSDPNIWEAMIWMHRILTNLGDEKVVEAALRAWQRLGDGTRSPTRMSAALSAALSAAMQMEGKDG